MGSSENLVAAIRAARPTMVEGKEPGMSSVRKVAADLQAVRQAASRIRQAVIASQAALDQLTISVQHATEGTSSSLPGEALQQYQAVREHLAEVVSLLDQGDKAMNSYIVDVLQAD